MENHPIPQDVTGFQFKLIGNMTIKQFAYVASGAVLAVVFYYTPLFILIKLPLVILFAFSGVALAFLPFEGRPLDSMMSYFLKALIVPNQYVYRHTGVKLGIAAATKPPVTASLPEVPLLSHLPHPQKQEHKKVDVHEEKEKKFFSYLDQLHKENTEPDKLDEKEAVIIQEIKEEEKPIIDPQAAWQKMDNQPLVFPVQGAHMISMDDPDMKAAEAQKLDEIKQIKNEEQDDDHEKESAEANKQLSSEVEHLQAELAEAKDAEAHAQKEAVEIAHEKTKELESQLQDVLADRKRLEEELLQLKRQLEEQSKDIKKPSLAQAQPKEETKHVRQIPKDQVKGVGLPNLPDTPNLITGIIKDPRGNVLPNILVEVKDKDGNSVRAFKTNPLGQFASATPLTNGKFSVEFEDLKGEHKFDTIEIEAKGEVMLPIEVTSQDAREELRRSLFS